MPRDENWRPKLSRIDDPIADDRWEYVTPEGERRISQLTVGRPVHYPKERLWYCPVLIEGHTQPRIKPIFGSGPVDSLMNAMTFVRGFFETNSEVLPGVKPGASGRPRAGTGSSQRGAPRKTVARKPRSRAVKRRGPRR